MKNILTAMFLALCLLILPSCGNPNKRAYLDSADIKIKNEDWTGAIQDFNKAHELDNNTAKLVQSEEQVHAAGQAKTPQQPSDETQSHSLQQAPNANVGELTKSAVDAICALAQCYIDGTGVPKNEAEAEKWLKLPYLDERASYMLGLLYLKQEKYTEAQKQFDISAIKGNADAMFYSGFIDLTVKKNKYGFSVIETAAGKGSELAKNYLVRLKGEQETEDKRIGQSLPKLKSIDIAELTKKAKAGDIDAICALAQCYIDGNGVPKNEAEAEKWLKEPFENPKSSLMLGKLYYTQGKLEKAKAQFYIALDKDKGNDYAILMYGLTLYLLNNDGTEDGIQWIKKAADKKAQGLPDYSTVLKPIKEEQKVVVAKVEVVKEGENSEKDQLAEPEQPEPQTEAEEQVQSEYIKQLIKKAEAKVEGHDYDYDAICTLAQCYIDGNGVTKDEAEAEKWLRLPYMDKRASYMLGQLYLKQQRYSDAQKQFNIAAYEGNTDAMFYSGFIDLIINKNRYGMSQIESASKKGSELAKDYLSKSNAERVAEEKRIFQPQSQPEQKTQLEQKDQSVQPAPQVQEGPNMNIAELTKKAEAGDVEAICALAQCYIDGYDVTENEAEAEKWLQKASSDEKASYMLGLLYLKQKKYDKAQIEFDVAATKGNADGMFYSGFIDLTVNDYKHGGLTQIKTAAKKGSLLAKDYLESIKGR